MYARPAGLLSRKAVGIFRPRDRAVICGEVAALAEDFRKGRSKSGARGTHLRSGTRIRLIREGRRKWTRGEPRERARSLGQLSPGVSRLGGAGESDKLD